MLPAAEMSGRGVLTALGLRQEYGSKVAVHGLSLQLHEGQLTSLLGHNGAGKFAGSNHTDPTG